MRVYHGRLRISLPAGREPIRLAAADLARDLGSILGERAAIAETGPADIAITIDTGIHDLEGWRIEIKADHVAIAGADILGAVYGIYEFSRQFLGVDPYWFWKDRPPVKRDSLTLPVQSRVSSPAAFKYRGWFLNDEDLLGGWKLPVGFRRMKYPFYRQVMPTNVLDLVLESLLRAGGNLIIPASFLDITNEPEAALARRAVSRGLYVSQHHVEPLGVSHFAFEHYWKSRGADAIHSYGADRDRLMQTWRAFAEQWYAVAGDKVIWQVGLRGRGDRPVWNNDPLITEANAGEYISRAITDQWKIIRSIDPRPSPPATITLWMEGADMLRKGLLRLPPEVTIVFADHGHTQMMRPEFHSTPREPGRTYGIYYHPAVWNRGPHLVQGCSPERAFTNLSSAAKYGDTEYAILNVANVREHVLGISAATEMLRAGSAWDESEFWQRWATESTVRLYRDFIAAWARVGDIVVQDGLATMAAKVLLCRLVSGGSPMAEETLRDLKLDVPMFIASLRTAVPKLDQMATRFSLKDDPFFDVNLRMQVEFLRHAYQLVLDLWGCIPDGAGLAVAERTAAKMLAVRTAAERGHWRGWYRGDRKVNVRRLHANIVALRQSTAATQEEIAEE